MAPRQVVNVSLPADTAKIVKRAAKLKKLSRSKFVAEAAHRDAEHVIRTHEAEREK